MKKAGIAGLAAALGFCVSTAASAVVVANGSFEEPGTVSGGWATYGAGSTAITGWTIGGAGVDLIYGGWQHADGDYSLDLSAWSAGSVSQQLTGAVVGESYTLGFSVAGNSGGGSIVKEMDVFVGGFSERVSFDTTGRSGADMGWTDHQITFIAGSETLDLSFVSLENSNAGIALDNVWIDETADVPLPTPVALLLGSLVGLGWLGRRRR